MDMRGQHTRNEILSQPEAWTATLDTLSAQMGVIGDVFRSGRYETIVFTGCGSPS